MADALGGVRCAHARTPPTSVASAVALALRSRGADRLTTPVAAALARAPLACRGHRREALHPAACVAVRGGFPRVPPSGPERADAGAGSAHARAAASSGRSLHRCRCRRRWARDHGRTRPSPCSSARNHVRVQEPSHFTEAWPGSTLTSQPPLASHFAWALDGHVEPRLACRRLVTSPAARKDVGGDVRLRGRDHVVDHLRGERPRDVDAVDRERARGCSPWKWPVTAGGGVLQGSDGLEEAVENRPRR